MPTTAWKKTLYGRRPMLLRAGFGGAGILDLGISGTAIVVILFRRR